MQRKRTFVLLFPFSKKKIDKSYPKNIKISLISKSKDIQTYRTAQKERKGQRVADEETRGIRLERKRFHSCCWYWMEKSIGKSLESQFPETIGCRPTFVVTAYTLSANPGNNLLKQRTAVFIGRLVS